MCCFLSSRHLNSSCIQERDRESKRKTVHLCVHLLLRNMMLQLLICTKHRWRRFVTVNHVLLVLVHTACSCWCCFRREECNSGDGSPPMYVNVNMMTGEVANTWIDALQAAWPGVQVLYSVSCSPSILLRVTTSA